MPQAIVLRPPDSLLLPDNQQYTNRFKIRSESSDHYYIVAQHKTKRWWSCGCFGWIRHGHCKHLDALGLSGRRQPYEALLR